MTTQPPRYRYVVTVTISEAGDTFGPTHLIDGGTLRILIEDGRAPMPPAHVMTAMARQAAYAGEVWVELAGPAGGLPTLLFDELQTRVRRAREADEACATNDQTTF